MLTFPRDASEIVVAGTEPTLLQTDLYFVIQKETSSPFFLYVFLLLSAFLLGSLLQGAYFSR